MHLSHARRISDEDIDMDDEDEAEDDSEVGTSIDMLAQAREADPETVRAREQEFEREVDRRILEEVPAGSSAATVDGGSAYSSMSPETGNKE
jgi:hypothetical protein